MITNKKIEIAIESLWLLAILTIPLACAPYDYFISESIDAHVELPKIALLKIITAIMLLLWLIKITPEKISCLGRIRIRHIFNNLNFRPQTWIWWSVGLFTLTTLATCVLSYDIEASLWGDVPGQDGYSTYNILSYVIIFTVISIHLKTIRQVRRIGAAVIIAGVALSCVGFAQHFGINIFGLMPDEPTARIELTVANPLFAGSLLLIPISVTLIILSLHLHRLSKENKPARSLIAWYAVWSIILCFPVSCLLFTLSRGPWISAGIFLMTFALSVGITASWKLSITILAIAIFSVTMAFSISQIPIQKFSSPVETSLHINADSPNEYSGKLIGQRLGSIKTEALEEGLNQRLAIWKSSWKIVTDRPWFTSNTISQPWIRYISGYGAESFRYVFQLESPLDKYNQLPIEAHYAHNYFIHQTVVQGVLGLISAIAVLLTPIILSIYMLCKGKESQTIVFKILISGIAAFAICRLVDQMLGIGRASDMILVWILLAVTAYIFNMRWLKNPPAPLKVTHRANTLRIGLIAVAIPVLVLFTWNKALIYPRAALLMSEAQSLYLQDHNSESLKSINKAIKLAPHVPTHYLFKNILLNNFLHNQDHTVHSKCNILSTSDQDRDSYTTCLAQQIHDNALTLFTINSLNWRSTFNLADSFYNLEDYERSHEYYEKTLELIPNSWVLHNKIAQVYISAGKLQLAKPHLIASLAITEQYSYGWSDEYGIIIVGDDINSNPLGSNSTSRERTFKNEASQLLETFY
ncbi:MAG: O-antigen ligase family protein [Chloroflexota bacterium]|nr:O-antigen ligase family protein [Chloroflexota bacterium]